MIACTLPMNIQEIINTVADDADDFLSGVSSMTEARPAIREYLKSSYPKLSTEEGVRVVAGILAILGEEGFFEGSGKGDSWADEGPIASEEEP